jgi:uncharacterized membrane protein YhhN
MSLLGAIALVAACLAAVIDWLAVASDDLRIERIAKPAVIVALIAAVLLAGPGVFPVRALLAMALAASLAGDLLLLPPGRFTAGLVAFLVAHLAYLALFLLGPLDGGAALVGLGMSAVVLLVAGRPILAGARSAGMGGPVAAYFGAICLMAIAATAGASPGATVGAWLFILSDALLGWDRFAAPPAGSPGGAARRRIAVMVTYHAAQILLTVAVLGSSVS